MRKRLLLTVLGLTGAIGAVASGAQAAFPGPNGEIAYWRIPVDNGVIPGVNGPPNYGRGIWAIGPNQLFGHELYSSQSVYGGPQWSPDGKRLVFTEQGAAQGTFRIQTLNADGSGRTTVLEGCGSDADWSPSGTRILFSAKLPDPRHPAPCPGGVYPTSATSEPTQIWRMNVRGGGAPTAITQPVANRRDMNARYSPDGSKIVFFRSDGDFGEQRLMVMNSDGSNEREILRGSDIDAVYLDPADWSPDGTRLVFGASLLDAGPPVNTCVSPIPLPLPCSTGPRGQAGSIFVVNADGTGLRNITPAPDPLTTARSQGGWVVCCWAPEGERLLVGNYLGLATMSPEGTQVKQLSPATREGYLADWGSHPSG